MISTDGIESVILPLMARDKSKTGWGGEWTEQKLLAFEKYVRAYLTIMNAYRDRYSVKWKLFYFDAFAGSGVRETENPSEQQRWFAELGIEPEECAVYKGAAERVLAIEKRGFDEYWFVDKDKESSQSLKERLLKNNRHNSSLFFPVGDANEYIKKLGEQLQNKKHLKALVLFDPFGMQASWEALTHLRNTDTDLWVLVPSGVIIGRLLKTDGTLMHPEQLTRYFGLSEKEILPLFYAEKTEKTLFGDETRRSKIEQPTKRIAEIYVARLQGIFKHVVTEPMVLLNSRSVPIYHFVFASNNKTATKIANDIIGKG